MGAHQSSVWRRCLGELGSGWSAPDGAVYAFGSAPYDGGMNGHSLNKPIVGITGRPDRNRLLDGWR